MSEWTKWQAVVLKYITSIVYEFQCYYSNVQYSTYCCQVILCLVFKCSQLLVTFMRHSIHKRNTSKIIWDFQDTVRTDLTVVWKNFLASALIDLICVGNIQFSTDVERLFIWGSVAEPSMFDLYYINKLFFNTGIVVCVVAVSCTVQVKIRVWRMSESNWWFGVLLALKYRSMWQPSYLSCKQPSLSIVYPLSPYLSKVGMWGKCVS